MFNRIKYWFDYHPSIFIPTAILSVIFLLIFTALACNTAIIEVGRDAWGTVAYRNVINGRYYVQSYIRSDAIVEDSLNYKMTDEIPNRYYLVREYKGLLGFRRDKVIQVIQ